MKKQFHQNDVNTLIFDLGGQKDDAWFTVEEVKEGLIIKPIMEYKIYEIHNYKTKKTLLLKDFRKPGLKEHESIVNVYKKDK